MFGCRRLSAILLLVAATVASLTTVEVGLSAEECRIAPGAAAPSGSHWLYRIHRIDHRRCWFLSSNAAIASRHRIAGATSKAPQVQLTNDTDENLPTVQKREEPALIAEASSTAPVAKEKSSETLVARAVPVIVYKTQSTSSEPASEVGHNKTKRHFSCRSGSCGPFSCGRNFSSHPRSSARIRHGSDSD
jgi:hypothetical protein